MQNFENRLFRSQKTNNKSVAFVIVVAHVCVGIHIRILRNFEFEKTNSSNARATCIYVDTSKRRKEKRKKNEICKTGGMNTSMTAG